MGKGRQLAGLIFDNYNRGRKKHIWISTSKDLVEDARRDLDDIGAEKIPVIAFNRLDYSAIEATKGVLFCTYAGLIGTSSSTSKTRIDQIVEWAGGDGEWAGAGGSGSWRGSRRGYRS